MSLRLRNLPIFPRFRGEWNAESVLSLDKLLQQLRDYMSSQPLQTVLDVEFMAPSMPTKVTEFQKRPIGVVAIAFDRVTDTGHVSAAMATPLQWAYDERTLTFPSLSGLAGSDTYRLRVLVLEDR